MRVATKIVIGTKVVATESFHHMGPAQGTWWKKYSWWVLPLVVILLILPAIGYWSGARIFSFSSQTTTVPVATPQPIVVAPVVIQQPVVPTTPTTPSALEEAKEAGVELPPKPKSLWELNP